jgi:solute carrier family 10 (sodium/bile acid cotransporter), member 7
MPYRILRDQWFLVGIFFVTLFGLWDFHQSASFFGKFLIQYHASHVGIALIFILSGLELEWNYILDAIRDWTATCLALVSIFVLAPMLAWVLSQTVASHEIRLGLLLISIVPTSLASGVVMTGIAGGRIAHALVITILANALSVLTIPWQLSLFLDTQTIQLPYSKLSFSLFVLVLTPLLFGILLKKVGARFISLIPFKLNIISRFIVLVMMFVGVYEGRNSILGKGIEVLFALGLVIILHLLLAGTLWGSTRLLQWKEGRRESVFFMGIQKTLPLCLWLQSTLFAGYGLVLTVCVFYHISQLVIDSYFATRLGARRKTSPLS